MRRHRKGPIASVAEGRILLARLVMAMIGAFLVPIGLFYQAWTSYPTLPPWPCLSAGVLFGAGILTCFISSYQYIIDVYQVSPRWRRQNNALQAPLLTPHDAPCPRQAGSATALGSLTFVRYIVSGGAVLFTREWMCC